MNNKKLFKENKFEVSQIVKLSRKANNGWKKINL